MATMAFFAVSAPASASNQTFQLTTYNKYARFYSCPAVQVALYLHEYRSKYHLTNLAAFLWHYDFDY
jgi:hypothetical protein